MDDKKNQKGEFQVRDALLASAAGVRLFVVTAGIFGLL